MSALLFVTQRERPANLAMQQEAGAGFTFGFFPTMTDPPAAPAAPAAPSDPPPEPAAALPFDPAAQATAASALASQSVQSLDVGGALALRVYAPEGGVVHDLSLDIVTRTTDVQAALSSGPSGAV